MALATAIITEAELVAFVGAPAESEWTAAATAAANGAVLGYLGRDWEDGQGTPADPPLPAIPPEVHAATLTAAGDIYHRRQAPLGISSAVDLAGVPLRVQRDWLAGVMPQLDRYRDLRQMIG